MHGITTRRWHGFMPPAMLRVILVLLLLLSAAGLWAAPRNVILMIGDGMGPDIVTAAGAYRYGAEYHTFGGTKALTLETLGHHYSVTTFSTSGKGYDFTWADGNREYPQNGATDSAAAATALATGVKTYNGAIAVDTRKQPLTSILTLAKQAGCKTGVVTSVFFYDATPASFAAHDGSRGNAQAITHEMLMETQPDVLMGAGNPAAFPAEKAYTAIAKADWDAITSGKTPYRLAQDRAAFQELITKPAGTKVLGLVRTQTTLTPANADGKNADPAQPTLTEMTCAALTNLANPAGFVLMVEGGAIDKFAHPNNLNATIGETLAFDDAVAATLAWIAAHGGWEENLLIITADHDTGYLNSVKPTAAGALPTVTWGTKGAWGGHTNRMVDLFCMGTGSERFENYALRAQDFTYGLASVVDNTTIFQVMKAALPQAVTVAQ